MMYFEKFLDIVDMIPVKQLQYFCNELPFNYIYDFGSLALLWHYAKE